MDSFLPYTAAIGIMLVMQAVSFGIVIMGLVMLKGRNPKSIPSYQGWIKWCNAYNLSNKYLGVNHVSI